ncbi:GNAT family N-acetyltransferase [Oscillospiraceae bacterium HV4-5-C5C]|nr:GNAT family N-acetyltransferase [Oscillospiraceae bacterium HV4-5-C5C]
MDIRGLSVKFYVRKLTEDDVEAIYQLSVENPMFFRYCPPKVTRESILKDMRAVPPQVDFESKYYIGFFEKNKLIAIMDLILGYPDESTAFIGLFMMSRAEQGKGIGSNIISDCSEFLKKCGYRKIRLAFAKGNPQSEAFWVKNEFIYSGIEKDNGEYIAVSMERAV